MIAVFAQGPQHSVISQGPHAAEYQQNTLLIGTTTWNSLTEIRLYARGSGSSKAMPSWGPIGLTTIILPTSDSSLGGITRNHQTAGGRISGSHQTAGGRIKRRHQIAGGRRRISVGMTCGFYVSIRCVILVKASASALGARVASTTTTTTKVQGA